MTAERSRAARISPSWGPQCNQRRLIFAETFGEVKTNFFFRIFQTEKNLRISILNAKIRTLNASFVLKNR